MPDLTTIATLDQQLHALVKRRDDAQDTLISALVDVDGISQRIAVLLDRYVDAVADDR